MATYLIKNNIAHFYSREDLEVSFPNTEVVHTSKHPIELVKTHGVKNVINVPFVLNKKFQNLFNH